MRRSPHHRIPALAAFAAVGLLVLLPVAPAQAHSYLVSSTPAQGSTITELPEIFSVTTNETLLDLAGDGSGFAIEISDSDGRFYGDGCVSILDSTVSTTASLGPAGDYRMQWQIVSSDGHTVSGDVPFTWEPSSAAELAEGSASAPTCGRDIPAVPENTSATAVRADADLTDVLWIGGAIVAVLVAGAVTLLVLRRPRRMPPDSE